MTASAPRTVPISRLNNPARTYRSRRFADALTNADAQLTAVVGRYSFNVGLSHPHLYDGLSRRTMAAGPDGAVWFTEYTGNKIGRITTAGAITEFPIPTAASGPKGITAASDGALWFTEYDGNKIGRVSTSGKISEFSVPTATSAPNGIGTGPDGALWFTENNANKIGRITIPTTPPPPSPPSPPPAKTPPDTEHRHTTPPAITVSLLRSKVNAAGVYAIRLRCPSTEVLCKFSGSVDDRR